MNAISQYEAYVLRCLVRRPEANNMLGTLNVIHQPVRVAFEKLVYHEYQVFQLLVCPFKLRPC